MIQQRWQRKPSAKDCREQQIALRDCTGKLDKEIKITKNIKPPKARQYMESRGRKAEPPKTTHAFLPEYKPHGNEKKKPNPPPQLQYTAHDFNTRMAAPYGPYHRPYRYLLTHTWNSGQ